MNEIVLLLDSILLIPLTNKILCTYRLKQAPSRFQSVIILSYQTGHWSAFDVCINVKPNQGQKNCISFWLWLFEMISHGVISTVTLNNERSFT